MAPDAATIRDVIKICDELLPYHERSPSLWQRVSGLSFTITYDALTRYGDWVSDLLAWARRESSVLLSEQLPRRWKHVQGVARRAVTAAPLFTEAEGQLLVAAGVLHDVGYSPEIAHARFHPLDGARHLRE